MSFQMKCRNCTKYRYINTCPPELWMQCKYVYRCETDAKLLEWQYEKPSKLRLFYCFVPGNACITLLQGTGKELVQTEGLLDSILKKREVWVVHPLIKMTHCLQDYCRSTQSTVWHFTCPVLHSDYKNCTTPMAYYGTHCSMVGLLWRSQEELLSFALKSLLWASSSTEFKKFLFFGGNHCFGMLRALITKGPDK